MARFQYAPPPRYFFRDIWGRHGSSQKTQRLRHTSAQTALFAEDGYVRVVEACRIQQFLRFRFSKGTNVELKMRSTLQQSAGLVEF